ncbi:MAG: hypothetical protein KJ799_11835 [Bacteroidetes bacterium]|nr:hypothetical protein [Bacteroidota bacterium]
MKRIFLFLFIISANVFAQTNLYVANFEQLNFNDGQPLPAERHFIIQGYTDHDIDIVEIDILESGVEKPDLLYTERWERLAESNAMVYKIPVKFNLFYDAKYDILAKFYKKVNDKSKTELQSALEKHFDTFIDQALVIEEGKVKSTSKGKNIEADLNSILNSTFKNYTTRKNDGFEKFSDRIPSLVARMTNKNLEIDDYEAQKDIDRFKTIVKQEAKKNFEGDLFLLFDKKMIVGYPTVKRDAFVKLVDSTIVEKKSFLLNIGYGSVSDGSSYQTNPFVGFSIPIANDRHNYSLWSKLSVSFGIFTSDFKNSFGETLTGPIVKKPIYAGVGYSVFDYFRIHAGTCILQNQPKTAGNFNMKNTAFYMHFGLSLDFNILAGIGSQSLKKHSYDSDRTYDIGKCTFENIFKCDSTCENDEKVNE